jgi:acyl-phosphate glycerol 3-phosphate acyltransferase
MTNFFLISIIAYLVGSFPTAYLITKKLISKDVRKIGSGNIGATNAFRALKEAGKKKLALIVFLIILIIDMAKGAVPIFLAQKFFPENLIPILILTSFFVVLGHNYSIFLKFTGGRGAACLMGILVYLKPISLLVWGLPVLFCAIPAQIILEKTGRVEKINWKKPFEVLIMAIGGQMAGRMAGLILAPILLYFYNPQIFLPIAAGTILLLIKNIPRFEEYFKKLKIHVE